MRHEFVFDDGGMNLLLSSALRLIREHLPRDASLFVFRSGCERLFAAGADMAEMQGFSAYDSYEFARLGQELFEDIERLRGTTVALIDGDCFGGALDLVLSFDPLLRHPPLPLRPPRCPPRHRHRLRRYVTLEEGAEPSGGESVVSGELGVPRGGSVGDGAGRPRRGSARGGVGAVREDGGGDGEFAPHLDRQSMLRLARRFAVSA